MQETPSGTPVGVDDPYEHVDRCDHCTDEGTCRFAFERFETDPTFARERRDDEYRCPVVNPEATTSADAGTADDARAGEDADADDDWEEWADCPNFRSTTDGKECRRCGLEERRLAHDDAQPLLEEHHLSYADRSDGGGAPDHDGVLHDGAGAEADERTDDAEADRPAHEITVALCRWCHAKVHQSWARVDDDASPDPEAVAAREQRRGRELEEASFQTAAERFDDEE